MSSRLALGVLVLLGLAYALRPRPNVSGLALERVGEGADPCAFKQRCLIAYVSPWCPACRQAHGLITELREHFEASTTVGVKVVVGLDTPDGARAGAKSFEGPTFVDLQNRLYDKVGFSSVPSFAVVDAQGRVVQTQAGFIPDVDTQVHQLGLDGRALAKLRR
jgi:thiol-disulfide isomerase/thioredoxin